MGKQREAFQLFNEQALSLNINDEMTKLKLKKECNLSDYNIRFIASKIKQFQELKKIMKEEVVFGAGGKIADETVKIVFEGMKNTGQQDDIKKQQ